MPLIRKTKEKKDHDHGQKRTSQLAYVIPSEDLRVIRELGEGQYGVVELGEWKSPNGDKTFVAIKSLKNMAVDGVYHSVLREAETMLKLCHENIVKFYGISLPFGEEQLKLITEFALYGSLEENFTKKNKNVMKVLTLCKFACQVAHGMHYLASQQLVHRDLATRNILLYQEDLVKISDFGLARSLEGDGAKKITCHTKLAIAWMPPEAIGKSMFSPASDVWSYGITLWEMFSFGQQPWKEFSLKQTKQIIANQPSRRLAKPHTCPDGFYELIMLKTWANDPKDRPTFEYIVNDIMPQIQPKEGTTKACHKATEPGHLSFDNREKVTIISRVGKGMLLVQSENCSIGLIDEKHVEFPKKAGSGSHPLQISGPFEVKKRDSKELLAELQKMAGAEANAELKDVGNLIKHAAQNQDHSLLDLGDDEVALDPNYVLFPDPYPALPDWRNTGPPATGQDTSEYEAMRNGAGLAGEDYTNMDPLYFSLKVTEGQETRHPGFPPSHRPARTMSESEVLISDPDYEVPSQNVTGSKDDSSIQLGPKGNPAGKITTLVIAARPDLIDENNLPHGPRPMNRPYATTTRKRPVPTPRRNTMQSSRPFSYGTLDLCAKIDKTEPRRENESKTLPDTPGGTYAAGQRKVWPKLPLPYESTRIVNAAELAKGDADGVVKSESDHSQKITGIQTTGEKQRVPDEGLSQRSRTDMLLEQPKNLPSTFSGDTASVITHDHDAAGGDSQPVISQVSHDQGESPVPAPSVELTGSCGLSRQPEKPRYENSSMMQDLIDFPPEQHEEYQTPAPSVELEGSCGLSQQPERPRYENSSVMRDLIDFSPEQHDEQQTPAPSVELEGSCGLSQQPEERFQNSSVPEQDACPPLPPKQHTVHTHQRPVYDKPLSLAMYPDIPSEVLNQPPPRSEDLFGGTLPSALPYSTVPLFDLHGGLGTSHQPLVEGLRSNPSMAAVNPAVDHVYQDAGPANHAFNLINPLFNLINPTVNPAARPFDAAVNPVNLDAEPVFQAFSPPNPVINHGNSAINPANQASKPDNPAVKPVNPGAYLGNLVSVGNEGSYGEEIQQVCGKDIACDCCYAALLQCQGDVEQVVHMVKAQKLAKITGKSEQFCTRTLTHCSWDLNRAAVYILDHYEDKDV